MIIALMFFLGIFILMGLTELILTGILHISYYIERKKEEKDETRYDKYRDMFKYNP